MPANPELGYNPTEEVVGSGTEVSNENAEALVSPEQIGNEPLPENIIAQAISQVEKISNENNEKIKKVNETMELNEKRTQDDLDTLNELVEMGISSPKTKSKVMERFNSTNTSCLAEISNVKEVAKEQLATVLQEIKNIDISQVTAELKSAIDKINKTAENWGVTNLGPEASNNNTETSDDNGFVIGESEIGVHDDYQSETPSFVVGESAIGVPGGEVTMDNKEAAAKVAPEASNDNAEALYGLDDGVEQAIKDAERYATGDLKDFAQKILEKSKESLLSSVEQLPMTTRDSLTSHDSSGEGRKINSVEFSRQSISQLESLSKEIDKFVRYKDMLNISKGDIKAIIDKFTKIDPEEIKNILKGNEQSDNSNEEKNPNLSTQWNSKYKEVFGKLKTLESSLKDDTSLDQLKRAA